MGKVSEEGISPSVTRFIEQQRIFFVSTAPNDKEHHVNVSPKTPGSAIQVIGPRLVAYADLTGSGSETAAHVLQNGRITFMWCNMEEGSPQIIRVFGSASIVLPNEASSELRGCFPRSIVDNPGFRAIFVVNVSRVSRSCGYSMPVMTFKRSRSTLDDFANKTEKRGYHNGKIPNGMAGYRAYKNSYSIDGLPSISLAEEHAVPMKVMPTEGFNLAAEFEPEEQGTASEKRARALMEEAKRSPALHRIELPPLGNRPYPRDASSATSEVGIGVVALVLTALAVGSTVGFLLGRRVVVVGV
jgi:hypothetical protein